MITKDKKIFSVADMDTQAAFELPRRETLALVNVLFVFRRDRRCLHDVMAGTRVVRTDWPPP